MDEWVAWEAVEGTAPRGEGSLFLRFAFFLCPIFLSSFFCKGDSHPATCAQRTAEGGGFLIL
jgi:hypothetical protein